MTSWSRDGTPWSRFAGTSPDCSLTDPWSMPAGTSTETSWRSTSSIAEQTGARTLDALHLGAAQRVGGQAVTYLTFDVRQGQAARNLGLTVIGA